MFVFATIANFGEPSDLLPRLGTMLRAWPVAAPDGQATEQTRQAAAGILRWEVNARDRRLAPLWLPERQLLIAGDVRLYNRGEVAAALGLPPTWRDLTDLQLTAEAVARWGEDTPRRLRGDFAFAVWNEQARTLTAARDQMGVRPLYHRREGNVVYLASDVSLLLPLMARPFDTIDDQKILERFIPLPRSHERTYFRGVSMLRPGHTITFTDRTESASRYWSWRGAGDAPASRSYRDVCVDLDNTFTSAVRDRLESDAPLVAHASGGFDSSAILMICDEIYRAERSRPALVTASALTRGHPSDDSRYMEAVAARTLFERVTWNALDPDLSDIDAPHIAFPGMRRGIGGGPRREFTIARQRGARILLSGTGGDSIMFAFGILRDLLRHGRWTELANEVFRGSFRRVLSRLARASLGVLPPPLALRWARQLFGRSGKAPRWLGPRLRACYPLPLEDLEIVGGLGLSHLSCESWARITSPQFAMAVDSAVVRGTLEGVEVRAPFLDFRLIEQILSVPWPDRVPRGDFRRLGRDAIGHRLPAVFSEREDQGSWSSVWAASARHLFPATRRMLTDGVWLSAPYIEHDCARQMLNATEAAGPRADHNTSILVSEFGVLEAWLRKVFGYDTRLR